MDGSNGTPRTRSARLSIGALAAALLLLGAACSSEGQTASQNASSNEGANTTTPVSVGGGQHVPVTAPGVTDTEIHVGGIAAVTNPLGIKMASTFDGTQAYFNMVNDKGGIYGRKLVLKDKLDDKLANNTTEVERLVTGGDTFAVLPVATLLFTGADALVRAKMPTFGWLIQNEWAGTPADPRSNLFGESGSVVCADCTQPWVPVIAKEAGKHKIGLVAYSVAQSAACAKGTEDSFAKYGKEADAELAFSDKSIAFGVSDLSVQVSKMKDLGVDLVFACMDSNATVTLAREIKRQDLKAVQLMANSYDHDFLKEYGDLFEGSLVRTDFTTWEVEPKPAGVQRFIDWMSKAGSAPTENAMVGWLNADLFVAGLTAAGPSFDQQKVIDAINTKLTNYTADGILHGVDWSKAHTTPSMCSVTSEIKDSQFVPVFGANGSPFLCAADKNGQLTNDA